MGWGTWDGEAERRVSEAPEIRLLIAQPGWAVIPEGGRVLQVKGKCIDVVAMAVGGALDELWGLWDNGILGLRRQACKPYQCDALLDM